MVSDVVYDVTSFLSSHPAGKSAILRHAGTDATEDFGFHSKVFRHMPNFFFREIKKKLLSGCEKALEVLRNRKGGGSFELFAQLTRLD